MDKQEYSLQDTESNPTLSGTGYSLAEILCPILGTQQSRTSISKCPEENMRTAKAVENMV